MRQTAAEYVEPEVKLKTIAQVVDGILPERTVLVEGNRLFVNLKERRVVYLCAAQQAEKLYGLDGQQGDDAPYPLRGQIADGNEYQTIARIKHQDVAVVESYIDEAEHEEQAHTPGETAGKGASFLLLVVVHDEETQSEEHGENPVHFSGKQPRQHGGYRLVARQRVKDRLFREDVEVLHGVVEDDAGHSDSPQGIGNVNSRIGQLAALVHIN